MNIGLGKHGIPYPDIHDMFEETTTEIGPPVLGVFLIDHLTIFGIAEVYEEGLDEEVIVIGAFVIGGLSKTRHVDSRLFWLGFGFGFRISIF
jgi:hypothetical protein